MTSHTVVERWLSAADHRRLSQHQGGDLPDLLQEILDFSDVLPASEMRPDAVTLYAPLLVRDEGSGATRQLTLCCPEDAAAERGWVSVLSPIGLALLGRLTGSQVRYCTPTGRELSLCILGIQPPDCASRPEGSNNPELGFISPP